MSEENKVAPCPKCEGEMIRGCVPDLTYGAYVVGCWHEGTPKRSWWTETRMKAPETTGFPIGAFRCAGCGFLEFYANPEFIAT